MWRHSADCTGERNKFPGLQPPHIGEILTIQSLLKWDSHINSAEQKRLISNARDTTQKT